MVDLFSPGSIVNTQAIRRFIRHFARENNWHNLDIPSANLGYGWIHYALVRMLQPKRVLCIGSKYGFVPAVCALACKDNKKGIVDFVDAGYDQTSPHHNAVLGAKQSVHWGGVGFWKKTDVKKHFDKFNVSSYIAAHIITSEAFYQSNTTLTWGYIYLDGNHSYRGVKADFHLFWPRLTQKGILAIHDIYTQKLGGLTYGVGRFLREMKRSRRYNCIEIPGAFGLGLIQK